MAKDSNANNNREVRLAARLRDNLHRRKDQSRAAELPETSAKPALPKASSPS